MHPRFTMAFGILLAAAAAYLLWGRDSRPVVRAGSETSLAVMSREPTSDALPIPDRPGLRDERAARPPAEMGASNADLANRLATATDYRELARVLAGPASEGDPAAQYFLSEALHYCDRMYRFYFIRRAKRRTLDEALQWASTRPSLRLEEVREVYDRCHALSEEGASEFGAASEWLEKATDAGHPIALATTARRLLLEAHRASYSSEPDADTTAMLERARRLGRQALESKEPAVLWMFGEAQGMLTEDPVRARKARFAWWLVACRRGYLCDDTSPWYRMACYADPRHLCIPGETIVDVIRREAQNDFIEIEEMAEEIDDRLDRDSFDELLPPIERRP